MNRFDEIYDIRLAYLSEIPSIMQFIDEHWKKDHILARDRDFFEYEMVVDNQVNVIIAKRKSDGRIDGLLGFLPCSKSEDKLDAWGVIWKTIDGAVPMLGMELKKRLMVERRIRTDVGVGANYETSVPLLGRIFHYYVGKMKHYYCLADRDEYKIAQINKKIPFLPNKSNKIKWISIENKEQMENFFDFNSVNNIIPFKDAWYYNKRFLEHPIYEYKLWGLENLKGDRAILTTRIQECNGTKATRIVDYIGYQELFCDCGNLFLKFLEESEYVDFYFDGFNEQYAIDVGMIKVEENDVNIIPDYFNPFEQRNVDIWVDSSDHQNVCMFFKADGDQDRPV